MERNVNVISEQLGTEKRILAGLCNEWNLLDAQMQSGDGDPVVLRNQKNRSHDLQKRQWDRVCAVAAELAVATGQPMEHHLGPADEYPFPVPTNLETGSMKDHRQQLLGLAGPRGGGDAVANRRGGPRLTVFSPQTGERFTAVRKGESVATKESPVGLGDFLIGGITGGWGHIGDQGARAEAIRLAQEAGSFAGGGLFIAQEIWPQHLDMIRARAKVFQAGLQTVMVDDIPLGSLKITETVSGPSPTWIGELEAATASAITFKATVAYPTKLVCYVPCSRELLADSVNAAPAIESAILGSMAAEIDRACLLGDGAGTELRGVANHPNAQTVAAVGTPASFTDLISALRLIYTAGYDGAGSDLAWLYSPREMATYGAFCDLQGQPLVEPKMVADLQHLVASALPTNEGGGANESRMVVGPFEQAILFVRQRPQIEALREGTITDSDGATLNATSQDAVILRCTMRVALAVLRPTWFAVLSGVTSA